MLVIIGLLIGAILKGIEMINSAKVRRLAELSSGVQSAYAGFTDRYRRVPGDWNATAAATAIGAAINGGGNNNGRIDNPFPINPKAEATGKLTGRPGVCEGPSGDTRILIEEKTFSCSEISGIIQICGEEFHDMLRGIVTPREALRKAQERADALIGN